MLPALGETEQDLALLQRGVAEELDPVGAVEDELVSRIALLLWRLRRVALAEVAMASNSTAVLPPHPDTVTGESNDPLIPLPPDATLQQKLGRVRAVLAGLRAEREWAGLAAGVLAKAESGNSSDEVVMQRVAFLVLDAASGVLGWPMYMKPDPWLAVVGGVVGNETDISTMEWSVGLLVQLLDSAARTAGLEPAMFRKAVLERLAATAGGLVAAISECQAEEQELAGKLLGERAAGVAAGVYGDEAMVARVAKAEGHLSRELDRALSLLERLRAIRREPEKLEVWSATPPGLPAG